MPIIETLSIASAVIGTVSGMLQQFGIIGAPENQLGTSASYWADITRGLSNGSYTHKEMDGSNSMSGRTAWGYPDLGIFKPYSEQYYFVNKNLFPITYTPPYPIVFDWGEGSAPNPGNRPGYGKPDYNYWHNNIKAGGYLQKTGFDRLMADYNPVLAKAVANAGLPDDVYVTQNRPVYTFNGSAWQIGPLTFYDKEGNFYEVDSSLKVSLSDANTKTEVNNGDLIGTFQGQSVKNALSVSAALFAEKQLEDAQEESKQEETDVVQPISKFMQFLKDYGSYMFLIILGTLFIYFFKLKKQKK